MDAPSTSFQGVQHHMIETTKSMKRTIWAGAAATSDGAQRCYCRPDSG